MKGKTFLTKRITNEDIYNELTSLGTKLDAHITQSTNRLNWHSRMLKIFTGAFMLIASLILGGKP